MNGGEAQAQVALLKTSSRGGKRPARSREESWWGGGLPHRALINLKSRGSRERRFRSRARRNSRRWRIFDRNFVSESAAMSDLTKVNSLMGQNCSGKYILTREDNSDSVSNIDKQQRASLECPSS